MIRDNIILTDADGVLLNWAYGFNEFMKSQKWVQQDFEPDYGEYHIHKRYGIEEVTAKRLVSQYNASARMLFCKPLRDSVKYVRKLYEEHGYKFHVITSQTDDKYAAELRKQNLCNIFGEEVFDGFTILGCGVDKDDALVPYAQSGCYWIEDKPSNANLALKFGLEGILVDQLYNRDDVINDAVTRCSDWKAIYKHITGEWNV